MLSKNHNGKTSISRFALLFFLQISFLKKLKNILKTGTLRISLYFFLVIWRKKKIESRPLRISEGVIHLNIYDSLYIIKKSCTKKRSTCYLFVCVTMFPFNRGCRFFCISVEHICGNCSNF